MMNLKQLLKHFGLDAVYGLDWETFWSKDYTLRKLPTTEYVTDPRFKAHMVAVQKDGWAKARVMSVPQFKTWARTINWSRCGACAHHSHFDGLILSHHFGIQPKFWFDTLSMGRALLPIQVGKSLDAMCRALGLPGKQGGEVLLNTQGLETLTREQFKTMAAYAGNDIEQTWALLMKMLPYLPIDEYDVIDSTVQMYTTPILRIDEAKMLQVVADETQRKDELLKAAKATKSELSKNDSFIARLNSLGIPTPMKCSPAVRKREGKDYVPTREDLVPALSKQDQEFKDLLKHKNPKVRALVEARFASKSNNLEKKATRLGSRSALGAVPVYLNYAGAKTLRWSGADEVNMQNMNRGSGMRKAIHAPEGCVLIIADQAQIEARLNAWFAGQDDKVEAFRRKEDVYKLGAAGIYCKPVDQITKDERFVGKTAELGLGYQAGGPRFADMLRIGQFGPPVDISDSLARDTVAAWRQRNSQIVKGWKETQALIRSAFVGKQQVEHRYGIVYEGRGDVGFIHHIPTGMSMRFDGVACSDDGDLSYISEYRPKRNAAPTILRTKLYGGLEVENRTQFLGRMSIADNIVKIKRSLPFLKLALTTHDEVVFVSPKRRAERALRDVVEIMTTPPSWAPGMPFSVDAHISVDYDK